MTTNWQQVIKDIRATMPASLLAETVGIKPSTLSELQSGRSREPRHSTALRLLAIHKRIRRKRAA